MSLRSRIEDFLAQPALAVVGVSRNPQKFGSIVFRELLKKGYTVFPVNPELEVFDGQRCYPEIAALPSEVGGVLLVVPPAATEAIVSQVAAAGIGHVWMQQGAESPQAIRICEEQGISVVAGECLLMYAQPVGFPHSWHRAAWRVLGKLAS